MKKNILLFLITTLLFSCKQVKEDHPKEFEGDIITINDPIEMNIEDLILEYDTIRLESSDKSLIADILMMSVMNTKLYILHGQNRPLHIFSLDGKFIASINDRGKGPNEYISFVYIDVDPVNKKVIFADAISNRIFIYDENGVQEKVIPIDSYPVRIIPDGTGGFINIYNGTKGRFSGERENYVLHFLDSVGVYISGAILNETPKSIDIMSQLSIDYLADNSLLFQPILSDTVYRISNRIVTPYYLFVNHSKYKSITSKDRKEMVWDYKDNLLEKKKEDGYLLFLGNIFDLDSYVFASSQWGDNRLLIYYSKETKRSFTVRKDKISGNSALKKVFLKHPSAAYGDRLIVDINSFDAIQMADELPDGKLKTFFNSLSEDDNPVLISFKIKFPEQN